MILVRNKYQHNYTKIKTDKLVMVETRESLHRGEMFRIKTHNI